MSRKPESKFVDRVNALVPRSVYREKMANPYRSGTPDLWYSGSKADLWVEYKYVVLPARNDSKLNIGLSSLQYKWLTDRSAQGRYCWCIVGCGDARRMLGGRVFIFPHDVPSLDAFNNMQRTDFCAPLKVISIQEIADRIFNFVGKEP